ncbi:hyaluronidase-4-like [Amblyraja radiata]|uniref:hyaluronidase-4-like n=1 Tax=Amblyraja radiata TaxID=386614 RepID=UPI001402C842|nr:hyaluronidase-4-like [Amblyraja radiata]
MAWTWCDPGRLPASYPVYATLCLLSLTSVGQGTFRKPVMPPLVEGQPFQVYWNVPTARCSSHKGVNLHLDDFGIVSNRNERFVGEKITIFYSERLGIYPSYYDEDPDKGGLPQNMSLKDHLRQARVDIHNFLSKDYAGMAVIEWVEWRALYARNTGSRDVYQAKSQELVRGRNPRWNQSQVEAEAKNEFDQAARIYMSSSLRLGQSMRPKAYWGFALFPDCYNGNYGDEFTTYDGHCPDIEIKRNTELTWMWTQSSALFPSVYLEEALHSERGKLYARYRIKEAIRVALLTKEEFAPPVYIYCRSHYIKSRTLTPLKEIDLVRTLGESAAMGVSGAILWGSIDFSRTKASCQAVQKQMQNVLGPYILNLTAAVRTCSLTLCANHGRCFRRNAEQDVFLHLNSKSFRILKRSKAGGGKVYIKGRASLLDKRDFKSYFQCQCYRGWNGVRCSRYRKPSASCRAETSPLTLVLVLLLSLLLI